MSGGLKEVVLRLANLLMLRLCMSGLELAALARTGFIKPYRRK